MSKRVNRFTTFGLDERGFSLIELLLIMGIIATLLGFATINLLKIQHTTSVAGAVDQLSADLKSQQIKAMNGATYDSTNTDNYGIAFQSHTYTLFHGTYTLGASTNFIVSPDSTTFSGLSQVIFTKRTGEIVGGAGGTVTVTNSAGTENEVLTLNRLGVITDIH